MNTFLISILLVLINYLFITFAFYRFGRDGLYICIPITIILANLQVVVTIDFFTLTITLGNVAYASSYLITDLLGELYGHDAAKRGVNIGFFTLIMMTVIMNVVLLYQPTPESKLFYDSLQNIFSIMPRIALASLMAYYISQRIDVLIYHTLKQRTGKYIWIRNNLSTMISQIFDTFTFTLVAFYGVFPNDLLISIFFTTYVVKFLIAAADTPFMYLGVKLANKYKIDEDLRIKNAI